MIPCKTAVQYQLMVCCFWKILRTMKTMCLCLASHEPRQDEYLNTSLHTPLTLHWINRSKSLGNIWSWNLKVNPGILCAHVLAHGMKNQQVDVKLVGDAVAHLSENQKFNFHSHDSSGMCSAAVYILTALQSIRGKRATSVSQVIDWKSFNHTLSAVAWQQASPCRTYVLVVEKQR